MDCSKYKLGIDVSSHQKSINFKKVRNSGINFVIIRSSYRDKTDPYFFRNVENAKKSGVQIYGIYHFSYALNVHQTIKEADLCVQNSKKAGLEKDTILFFDFEYDTIKKAEVESVILGREECNSHAKAFCERVIELGYQAGIYSDINFYRTMYDKDLIRRYKYWLADYTGGPNYKCAVQQYTSSGKVNGISGRVDMDKLYEFNKGVTDMAYSRGKVVSLIKSWIGKNEKDGSYRTIIDIYNSLSDDINDFPRKIKMQYGWAWCAATWSALAIKLNYTEIMPIEISCTRLIEKAMSMGIWVENDSYVPSGGDGIIYDWQDSGNGDCKGQPDHIGTVVDVYKDAGYMVVAEGNYSDAVKYRTISLNGKYIRGFITPRYTDDNIVEPDIKDMPNGAITIESLARECISGRYGNYPARKTYIDRIISENHLKFLYEDVRNKINSILSPNKVPAEKASVVATCSAKCFDSKLAGIYETTAKDGLNIRNDAGTNKKSLAKLRYRTSVRCYGFYNVFNNAKWYYVTANQDGIMYQGFVHSAYLVKK